MSKSFLVSGNNGANFIDNASRFFPLCSNIVAFSSASRADVAVRDAGTFSKLYIHVVTNTASVTSVITFQDSGADTAITVSVTSDATGIFEDTSNTAALIATDEASIKVTVPNEAGTNNLTIDVAGVQFEPDTTTNTITFPAAAALTADFSTASTTEFMLMCGLFYYTSVEAIVKARIRKTFTSSDLYTLVQANARTTNTLFKTRKNGADGGQSITYGSGETNIKEDTSGSDSLAAGDDFNFSITTGTGTEIITPVKLSTSLINTSDFFVNYCMSDGATVGTSTTTYARIGGGFVFDATEADTQIYPQFTFTASELLAYVASSASVVAGCTVTLRDNGADSALIVSYAAAETGLKNDTSNTAEITSGTDEINYKIVNSDAVGTVSFTWLGIHGGAAAAATTKRRVGVLMMVGVGN